MNEAIKNILYGVVGLTVVILISMMSSQYFSDLDSKTGRSTAVSRIVDRAKKSLRDSEKQSNPLKAIVLSQDASSMVSAARMLEDEGEIEQKTKASLRNLAQAATKRTKELIGSMTRRPDPPQRREPPAETFGPHTLPSQFLH